MPFHSNVGVGFCSHCGRWLGSHDGIQVEAEECNEQNWITKVVGDLVQITIGLIEPLKPGHFATALSNYLEEEFGNNIAALARKLRMNRNSTRDLAEGTQRPRLGTILNVSAQMGLTPFDLLTGFRMNPMDNSHRDMNVEIHKQRRPRKFNKNTLLQALNQELTSDENHPPTMALVAERLGYDHSYLLNLFPAQCHAISDRYRQYQREQATNRQNELSRQVRDTATMLHERGVYPSTKQMQKYLLKAGILKEKAIWIVYKSVLKELGYTSE